MSTTRITIVTPSYNQGEYIERTILSVLGQGYDNLEYIVMDGGSSDNTVEIAENYKEKLTFISELDDGPEDAIRKGFAMATGEILAWLASDDIYEAATISTVAKIFSENPDVSLVYGRCHYIDRHGRRIGECPTESFKADYLPIYNIIAQPSAFFRKSAYYESGGISLALQQASDYDLWIRLTNGRKVIYIPRFLASYRLHYAAKTLGYHDPCVKFTEYIELTRKYYRWAPANRVYPFCLYRFKAAHSRLPEWLIIICAIFIAAYEYLHLNRGIDWRDMMLLPRNLKKLLFGWELEKKVAQYSESL